MSYFNCFHWFFSFSGGFVFAFVFSSILAWFFCIYQMLVLACMFWDIIKTVYLENNFGENCKLNDERNNDEKFVLKIGCPVQLLQGLQFNVLSFHEGCI